MLTKDPKTKTQNKFEKKEVIIHKFVFEFRVRDNQIT